MKKIEIFGKIIELKRKFIESLKPNDLKGHDGKRFTRKRSLTLNRLLQFILQGITTSLQLELDDYYKKIGFKEDVVTKQAVSKARTNLDPSVVKAAFELTTQALCSCDDLTLFKEKFRLCAIDGSTIALDNATALKEHFGCSGSTKDATTAMASVCYDPLNNIILDAGLYPYATSEREGARANINAVESFPKSNKCDNLYIFDRGYPSKELLAEFMNGNINFLMRVRKKFNLDFDLVEKKEKITFMHAGKPYTVRVFRIILESGETETLVTNVSKKYIKRKEIGQLYFKRWGIETKFDSLKNKLELENMSGRRPVTVYQDFWAKLDLANTMAALEYVTDDVISIKTSTKENKYEQTTNENRLINKFTGQYLDLLSQPDEAARVRLFDELVADISRRPVEVKPGRSFERTSPRKMKFCDRIKRAFR